MGCGCGNKGSGIRIKPAGGAGCPKCGSPLRSLHKMDAKTRRLSRSLICTNPKCTYRK